jgi:hypothetical protein
VTFCQHQVCAGLIIQLPKIYIISVASSTDVEHSFSQGRLNVSRLRHSLSEESTRAATVFGSWVGIEELVVTEDLIDNIQRKSFRGSKDGSAHRNIGGDLELDSDHYDEDKSSETE